MFWFVVWILLPCWVFWINLLEEIDLKIQSIYDWGTFDEYLNRSYYSEFSGDPFWDAMSDISDMSNKMRKSGEDYVKKSLNFYGCSMSNKEIRWILYYYVTGYRTDLIRSLKIEQWNYDSRKYVITPGTLVKYCEKFSKCMKNWASNVEQSCMEFFQKNYKAWEYNELLRQKVQTSRLWSDKYWNNTTDDSPYDVIWDLGVLSKLLYEEAQDPITPVFYDIPAFSNSKDKLNDNESLMSSDGRITDPDKGWENPEFWDKEKQDGWNGERDDQQWDNQQWDDEEWTRGSSVGSVSPLNYDESPDYDSLLEWLGAYSLASDGSKFYTNLCDNREEQEVQVEEEEPGNVVNSDDDSLDFDNFSDEQYQTLVDYMQNAVDSYTSLPPEKQDEIDNKVWDKSDYESAESPDELQATINKIKECYETCEGLRLDQKASCMVKCTCGEVTSIDLRPKIYDPDKFPWLGPIYIIRFCAVPAVNTKFSVWWKRIHSIEEWVREIYWVVDKLSREWRLWKWTQQYEFLDSSTKRIKFADAFAFSIDVEFVNIGNRRAKRSSQYEEKEKKTDNKNAQEEFNVENSLNTTEGRNYFRIITDEEFKGLAEKTQNDNEQTKEQLKSGTTSVSKDVHESEQAIHHVQVESYWDLWLDQQWELRKNVSGYIANMRSSATLLKDSKKCD